MYKRNSQGWLKHVDFILWDLLILQISFVLGYMIRFGWGEWPYSTLVYKSLAVVLTAVDFLIMVPLILPLLIFRRICFQRCRKQ